MLKYHDAVAGTDGLGRAIVVTQPGQVVLFPAAAGRIFQAAGARLVVLGAHPLFGCSRAIPLMNSELSPASRYLGAKGDDNARSHHAPDASVAWDIEMEFFAPYLRASDVVLDFGCATGSLMRRMAKVVAEVQGLEVNEASRRVAVAAGFRVYGSILEIPAHQRFNKIVSNHVLEHVRDVCSTLAALRVHLQPDGLLVVKLPIDDIRSAHQRSWSRDDPDWHLHTWTPRLFANVLFESGYEVVEQRIITRAWHPRLLWLRRLGLGRPAFWALAALKHRRQLLAVGRPAG